MYLFIYLFIYLYFPFFKQTLEAEMSSCYSLKNTEIAQLSESHIVALSSQKRMMEEKQNKLLQDLENKTISRELLLTNKLQEFIVKEEAHGKGKKNVRLNSVFGEFSF